MRFMRVDLPEPDGPITATYSPFWISKLTPRSAWISSEPIWYVRQRSSAVMIGPFQPSRATARRHDFFPFCSVLMRASSLRLRRVR